MFVRARTTLAYAGAIAATAIAIGIRALLDPWLGQTLTVVTLPAAVAFSVWIGGLGPATLSAVTGYVAANMLFIAPRGSLTFPDTATVVGALGFLFSASAIMALGVGMRAARRRALLERQQLDVVLRTIDDQFVMLDREWRYTYVNDRALAATRRRRDQLLGQVIWDLYPGLVGTEFERAARVAMSEQRPGRAEFYYAPRTNWLECRFYPSSDGIALLVNDVHGHRRTAAELAQRVAEHRALYELSDRLQHVQSRVDVFAAALNAIGGALGCTRAAILLFDHSGVMRFVAWRGLSDAYRAAVDGHSPWQRDAPSAAPVWIPEVATSELGPDLKASIAREGIRALAFVPLVSGSSVIGKLMLYYDAPHPRRQEEEDLALTIARQLASALERHRSEDERRQSELALLDANRRKDEFLATLAHELRNPLAPIVNMLHVLQRVDGDPALQAQARATMERQLRHLVRLVDDLLDVGRITRNRLELRREVVELAGVMRQAVETSRSWIDEFGHSLTVDLPSDPLLVDADPVRLAQVFGNLLNNAAKYTPRGGAITLAARRDGGDVVITVTDTGIGIPQHMLYRVFDLFTQVDGPLEHSRGGLGVGLTLVKQLVEMHGGRVAAASAGPNAGTTVTVRLPVLAEAPTSQPAPASHTSGAVTPRRVLIVDDNRDAASSLADMLRLVGHEPTVVHDGIAAVATAEDVRPDVVLLDLGMPTLDGFETCRRLRAEPWSAGMKVIAVTGWGQEDYRRRSEAAGFDDHLVKPVDPARLLELIASQSRRGERGVSLPGR